MKGKRLYKAPYTMRPTETFLSGTDVLVGYIAGIYDDHDYLAGWGLRSQVFDSPESVIEAWGDRPTTYPYHTRDVEWRDWCGEFFAPSAPMDNPYDV